MPAYEPHMTKLTLSGDNIPGMIQGIIAKQLIVQFLEQAEKRLVLWVQSNGVDHAVEIARENGLEWEVGETV